MARILARGGGYTGGMTRIILSHYQAQPLLRARKAGETQVRTSVDLNLTQTLADLTGEGLALPDGRLRPVGGDRGGGGERDRLLSD